MDQFSSEESFRRSRSRGGDVEGGTAVAGVEKGSSAAVNSRTRVPVNRNVRLFC